MSNEKRIKHMETVPSDEYNISEIIDKKRAVGEIPYYTEANRAYDFADEVSDRDLYAFFKSEYDSKNKDDNKFTGAGATTFTRKLVANNAPRFVNWSRDGRSVNFTYAMPIEGSSFEDSDEESGIPKTNLESIEADLRGSISLVEQNKFVTTLLLHGFAVYCCGLNDIPWVPDLSEVVVDYVNNDFVEIRRHVSQQTLMEIIQEGNEERTEDSPLTKWEADEPDEFIEQNINPEGEEIRHGNLRIGEIWLEYIEHNNNLFYRRSGKTMFWCYFDIHAGTNEPLGVFRTIYGEEKARIRAELAIQSRISRASDASLIVAQGLFSQKQMQRFYKNKTISVDMDKAGAEYPSVSNQFAVVPSQVEEVQFYTAELDRLFQSAQDATGLVYVNSMETMQTKTATEVLKEYERSTEKSRMVVDAMAQMYGEMLQWLALRDYAINVEYEVTENPFDAEAKLEGYKLLIEYGVQAIENDPMGEKYGAVITPETIKEALIAISRLHKINPNILSDARPTALTDQSIADDMQAKRVENETKIADAQLITANAEKQKGEAALATATSRIVETTHKTGLAQDKMVVDIMKIIADRRTASGEPFDPDALRGEAEEIAALMNEQGIDYEDIG